MTPQTFLPGSSPRKPCVTHPWVPVGATKPTLSPTSGRQGVTDGQDRRDVRTNDETRVTEGASYLTAVG